MRQSFSAILTPCAVHLRQQSTRHDLRFDGQCKLMEVILLIDESVAGTRICRDEPGKVCS